MGPEIRRSWDHRDSVSLASGLEPRTGATCHGKNLGAFRTFENLPGVLRQSGISSPRALWQTLRSLTLTTVPLLPMLVWQYYPKLVSFYYYFRLLFPYLTTI